MPIHTAIAVPGGILVAAAVWDVKTRRIPHVFPILLLVWAVVARACGFQAPDWPGLAWGLAVGLLVGVLSFAAGAMGGGDAKLLAALGAVLGPVAMVLVFVCVAVVGGVLAVAALCRGRKSMVYGPAVAVGYALAVWLA